jgi:amino acid transporter
MTTPIDDAEEGQPLLRAVSPESPRPRSPKYSALGTDQSPSYSSPEGSVTDAALLSRAVENDVLPETSTLGRNLSWGSAYVLVISRVFGSGIFATPGIIVAAVGSPGLALLLWVVGALIAACGLCIGLEFGCMLPRSGGDKVYLEFVYRRPRFLASTLVAVHVVLLNFTASNCIVFSQYALFGAGIEDPSDWLRKGMAVGLLTVITIIHAVFRPWGVHIQNILGWLKIGLIAFMALSGFWVVLLGQGQGNTDQQDESRISARNAWDDLWAGSVWNWGVIATSLFKVFYSFAGLENVNNVLNEVKDPVRTLRSVSLTALATASGLYLLVNLAYLAVVPLDEIMESGSLVAALFFEKVFGAHVGGKILPFAVALSAASNVMVVAFAMARVKQEIARQGFLPFSRILSSTKPFNSPLGGLIVNYIPSFLVITLPPSKNVYSFILEVEGYPGQIAAVFVAAGLLWLRYKRPDLNRPFKAWLPAVWLRIILSVGLLAAPFFPPSKPPESGIWYATYAVVGIAM